MIALRASRALVARRGLRFLSSTPDFEEIYLPAMTPTMQTGTIEKWHSGVGKIQTGGYHYQRPM